MFNVFSSGYAYDSDSVASSSTTMSGSSSTATSQDLDLNTSLKTKDFYHMNTAEGKEKQRALMERQFKFMNPNKNAFQNAVASVRWTEREMQRKGNLANLHVTQGFAAAGATSNMGMAMRFAYDVFFEKGISPIWRENVRNGLNGGDAGLIKITDWRRDCDEQEDDRAEIVRYFETGIATKDMLFAKETELGWERLGLETDFRSWFLDLIGPHCTKEGAAGWMHENLAPSLAMVAWTGTHEGVVSDGYGESAHAKKWGEADVRTESGREKFADIAAEFCMFELRPGGRCRDMMFGDGE